MVAFERALDAAASGVHRFDGVALGGEVLRQQLAQLGVVVDDEDAQLRRRRRARLA